MARLLTWTVTIDENGPDSHDIHNDAQCGEGASFADVYRAFLIIKQEVERQIAERRACPMNPKYGAGLEQFEHH